MSMDAEGHSWGQDQFDDKSDGKCGICRIVIVAWREFASAFYDRA
jgi:hypothetical protein